MRLGDGGFISTIDTIVALEALVIYSYNSRIKDITNLNVIVDVPDSNVTKDFHITGNSKIARTQTLDIKNVWGHINLQAYGAGQAIGNSLYFRFIIYDVLILYSLSGLNTESINTYSSFKLNKQLNWTLTGESIMSHSKTVQEEEQVQHLTERQVIVSI